MNNLTEFFITTLRIREKNVVGYTVTAGYPKTSEKMFPDVINPISNSSNITRLSTNINRKTLNILFLVIRPSTFRKLRLSRIITAFKILFDAVYIKNSGVIVISKIQTSNVVTVKSALLFTDTMITQRKIQGQQFKPIAVAVGFKSTAAGTGQVKADTHIRTHLSRILGICRIIGAVRNSYTIPVALTRIRQLLHSCLTTYLSIKFVAQKRALLTMAQICAKVNKKLTILLSYK